MEKSDIERHISNNILNIFVRPNSPETKIAGYDEEKSAFRVNVHARPEDNKANIEIIKFFSKLLKKKVTIKSGLKSKEKILKIE